MSKTELKVGTGMSAITPPLEVGFLTSSVKGTYAPFTAVRSPLKARALALQLADEVVVLVSLDLLGLTEDAVYGWQRFKAAACGNVHVDRVVFTCTHTHSAPETLSLSDSYKTAVYREWLGQLEKAIREAIADSLALLQPVSVVNVSSSALSGFSLQRRIVSPDGVFMSDTVQPIAAELFEKKPIDRRVRMLQFSGPTGQVLASMVHVVCHPVHEMLLPHVSPDFPGELCAILDVGAAVGFPMFLNGAAGNINPPTVAWGVPYAVAHAEAIANTLTSGTATVYDQVDHLAHASDHIDAGVRPEAGLDITQVSVVIRVVRIGPVALVFLPGEPFVETALQIERESPFHHTFVVGYAEASVGYIPTAEAFGEGGYEVGPGKWSYLPVGIAEDVCAKAVDLLHQLHVSLLPSNH